MLQKDILLPSELKIISEEANKGVYEINGLYPGYGHTIGNSLRRVILSSIPGWAVTKIEIVGVPHEFTTIEDVKEDAINIILNLKKVVFKVDDFMTDTVSLRLNKKGKGGVYAKDIETVTGVEVVNPDEYLFTISSAKKEVEINFEIKKGIGYVSKENLVKGEKLKVGEVVLDTGFTPIVKLSYDVTNTRVGDRTDFNKLVFEIETNGSVSPRDVIENAINILIQQLSAILVNSNLREDKTSSVKEETVEYQDNGDTIAVLDLDEEILGKLASAGIIKVADLVTKTDIELLKIDGIDEESLEKIKKVLKK